MNHQELKRSLVQLRLGGMADALDVRIHEAQIETMAPLDFLSRLVNDEQQRRDDNGITRRTRQAKFRDATRRLDDFDFGFNPKIPKKTLFDLATCRFIERHEDVLFLGRPGTGKSHLAQSIGHAAILLGYRVAYREAHTLLEDIAEAELEGRRRSYMQHLMKFDLLIVDDLGMRKLGQTAAEELLEVIMRRHERLSTIITSNRPVEDWGKMMGDTASVTALLDRLLHHGTVIECGPRRPRRRSSFSRVRGRFHWRHKMQRSLRRIHASNSQKTPRTSASRK